MGCLVVGLVYVWVTVSIMALLTDSVPAIVAAPLVPVVGVASSMLVADLLEKIGWTV